MNKWILIGIAVYLFLDNFALTFETTNDFLNKQIGFPVQVKLLDLIFNTGNTPDEIFKIYLDFVNKNDNQIK